MQVSTVQKTYQYALMLSLNSFKHHIKDIRDPEHPLSLEELKVVTEDAVEVDDERSYVRYNLCCMFSF